VKEYELTYIIRPDIDEEAVAGVTARVEQVISANNGRVLRTNSWGKRRLAYPINRHNEGHYILLRAELQDRTIREVERYIKLSEDIIRHLLVRVEPARAVEPVAAPGAEEPAGPA
jgi:small subunit ribosomal protein S6